MSEKENNKQSQPQLDDLISLQEAAELSGLTARHMRYLAVQGEIWAKKLGRNWFTTAQAVQSYMVLEHKPGPKPHKKSDSLKD
jgi:hypothetical protein